MDRQLQEMELDALDLDTSAARWLRAGLRKGTDIARIQQQVSDVLGGYCSHGLTIEALDAPGYRRLRKRKMEAYNQDGYIAYPHPAVVGAPRSRYDLGHEATEALYRRAHGIQGAVHENPREHAALDFAIVLPMLARADPEAYREALNFYRTEAPAAERVLIRDAYAGGRATLRKAA